MANMPMPAPEQPQGPQPQKSDQGSPSQMLASIHSNLNDLIQVMGSSPAFAQERQALVGIMNQFEGVVDQLTKSPGQAAPQAPQPKGGVVPMEAGANPNARPAL